MCPGVANQLA